ncbi:MAG: dephospho-CoA kinase [Synergistaceae bacterium]|jgi:dephospho-CoA kinase|uniref:dephospho-CoA kinase n=1 Tax=Aminivibrio sp. TaxID=1872489 RepID=UPI0016A5B2DF|nr:dephospho-CoA kinase [Synergistaceae bacterium]MDD3389868.1 dephospho-CoA kinase [Synergistaceae bacterium]MDD3688429.1 dephospho-CoA kinase [Synergistaceae bacterium]MDD4020482.1 dephospho-CoA kinase [Synergistaceae bacterium]MDD4611650.1 dephospho-CoA kinase [Synergistaceae bacterium]
MLALGVTGDVGAGKSTVSRIWREMGASVLDADEIVKSVWKRAEILEAASSRWGKDILGKEGLIVSWKVAAKAFSDPGEYRWMCGLIHPPVRVEMERAAASLEGWVVAEIPLLFEGGVPWWIDATVYVTADPAARASRNAARGLDSEELARRESFLLPCEEKKIRASIVLDNSRSREHLLGKARETGCLFRRLSGLVQFSVLFGSRDDAFGCMGLISAERLGAEFECRKVLAGTDIEDAWRLSFFTLEHLFPRLVSHPSMTAGRGQQAVTVRRIPYSRRLAISGELLP